MKRKKPPIKRGGHEYRLFIDAAVKAGCKLKAAEALAGGASIHCRDKDARTILKVAEHYRHPHLVGFLVHYGADPNRIVGKQGNSLLLRSIIRNDFGFAHELVKNGANVHLRNITGQNALMLTAKAGDVYFANDLLKAGARVDDQSPRTGDTALHIAARAGNTEMVSMILKYSPDLDLLNRRHYTALQESVAHGHTDTSAFLLDRMVFWANNKEQCIEPARATARRHKQPKLLELLTTAESDAGKTFTERVRPKDQLHDWIWRRGTTF